MPSRTVSDEHLLATTSELFRAGGFAAVSIADVADATGLQKSSLYHRFPDGKTQMAAEAVAFVGERFAGILEPLEGAGTTRHRVEETGRRLVDFYRQGRLNCLLESLSLADAGEAATRTLRGALEAWVSAFAAIARENGARGARANDLATDAIGAVEGALVLCRVTGDTRPFDRAITRLPDLLRCP